MSTLDEEGEVLSFSLVIKIKVVQNVIRMSECQNSRAAKEPALVGLITSLQNLTCYAKNMVFEARYDVTK